jgi:hypothetical protein
LEMDVSDIFPGSYKFQFRLFDSATQATAAAETLIKIQ